MSNGDELECQEMDLTLMGNDDSYSSDDIDEEYDSDAVEDITNKKSNRNDSGSDDNNSSTSFVVAADDANSPINNNAVTDEVIESMQHSIRFLKDRVSVLSKNYNELKSNYSRLEGLMKTVLETNSVRAMMLKAPSKRNRKTKNSGNDVNESVDDNVEIDDYMDKNIGLKLDPLQNYFNVKDAPQYTCSLTQGNMSKDVYFEGDYVVHLGQNHGGSKVGKIMKVFKKTVHVKTDAMSKDHKVWNIDDICKCNQYTGTDV